MASHPAAALYTPTPIEEAHAIYVYDALFGNFPPDGSIHLEAKATLKILEKSNVDAIILRTIWSVADPDGVRCLTDISQFHVVLRLIALAQDGLLEKEIERAFQQQRDQTTPVTVFKKTLWMSLDYTDCPLPSFKGVAMPAKEFLQTLSNRLRGVHRDPAPAPAPTPIPISTTKQPTKPILTSDSVSKTQTKSTIPSISSLKQPLKEVADPIPNEISIKKRTPQGPTIESAIQQMEDLGVTNSPNPDMKNLKELDPENFELYQEQAALERAIMESNSAHTTKPANNNKRNNSPPPEKVLTEEEALQKAIYESTASPQRPSNNSSNNVAVAAAAAPPKKEGHQNWLRMSSLPDSDSDSETELRKNKKKTMKGDAAYAEYVASMDPTPLDVTQGGKGKGDESQNSEEIDKKPAAKKPPPKTLDKSEVSKPAPKNIVDDRVDEYPQAVQELVMNGFELQKAIQGYKMLGDNFDDIVLFLTSNVTVKELVINGFNIHKVVQAYDLIGDDMDSLLQYLMANAT